MAAKVLIKLTCWFLIACITGCTSLKTFGLHQIDPDMPIETGDTITVYLNNQLLSEHQIIVTAKNEAVIMGKMVKDPDRVMTLRWDEIYRIEARQFDGTKTTTLIVLGIIIILGVASVVEDVIEDIKDIFDFDDSE